MCWTTKMADPKSIFNDDDCDSTPGSGLLEAKPACLKCGQVQRIMKCCTRCHSAFYCSQKCFARHWSVHKKTCHYQSEHHHNVPEQSLEHCQRDETRYRVIQHRKPIVPLAVNFQKAADELAEAAKIAVDTSTHNPQATSAENTEKQQQVSDEDLPGCVITLRYNKQKHKFKVCDSWEASTIFTKISTFLSCMADNMKVIHKGRQVNVDSVHAVISAGAVFQVVGEPMEDATGLTPKDIDVLMQQMGVERNVAVRALRQSQGDLIDAMMVIGNK